MTIFIPFGPDCAPAQILKDGGLRKQSMPFDWVYGLPHYIKDTLDYKFETWFDSSKLIYKIRRDGWKHTEHLDYKIESPDDLERLFFHHQNLTDSITISAFKRRINRFYKAIESDETIVFLTSSSEEDMLKNGLLNYFKREAQTDFIFLDWKESNSSTVFLSENSLYKHIEYTCRSKYGDSYISPKIASILKNLYNIEK